MTADSKKIAKMVESGAYFEQSRAWYRAMFIGPIAERTFFLIIALLAGLIGLFGFLALMLFLPVTDRPGVVIRNDNLDEVLPHLTAVKERGTALNAGLLKFFVESYVAKREGYDEDHYVANYVFIHSQSDTPTFADYVARDGRENPQSPAAQLGHNGKRIVTIHSVNINDSVEPKVATVQFSTETQLNGQATISNWTANLQFYYSDLIVSMTADPATGENVMKTQDPQFQVVSYALTQAP